MDDFPVEHLRRMFPALQRHGSPIFFDNAAGAQIPQRVFDAVNEHLLMRNVQRGGPYRESQEVDAAIDRARETVATFLNAADPSEVAFGMNATSFIRIVSLAIGQTLGERREIIVTDLDHEANVATWLALERDGAVIRWWKLRDDGSLHLDDLEQLLSHKTRVVACTVASNALGTIVDVAGLGRLAHAAGAEVFLDAVHYGPHGLIDVQQWQCDYLVCSGYKIFAPHMGFLWGRRDALDALPTFREDFIPNTAPAKIEVGTFVYENVAGMNAAIEYLAGLAGAGNGNSRQAHVCAMQKVRDYEITLSKALLDGIASIKRAIIYGVNDTNALSQRVPTICFNMQDIPGEVVSSKLAGKNIAVRHGHMYSPRLMNRLGVAGHGVVRASLVHYNTHAEIQTLVGALEEIGRA
jgi:cysteine desulfurase family protein (TIGR01976 family)